jgi:hypothetical protein
MCLIAAVTMSALLTETRYVSEVFTPYERIVYNQRKTYAKQAEQKIRNNGIKDEKVIMGMLANMWHESKWDHKVYQLDTNGAYSAGLFQLNQKGAGRGMTLEQMTNINHHMHRLFSLTAYKDWKTWSLENSSNISCGEISYQFAKQVERCAKKHRPARRVTADKWWKAFNQIS